LLERLSFPIEQLGERADELAAAWREHSGLDEIERTG
jgi:hypothetical protein